MLYKIILMSLLIFANTCFAGMNYQSPSSLSELVKTFITKNTELENGESLEVKINPSDIPNRLRACSIPLRASYPEESNREFVTAIEVSCNDNQSWHTFVPVNVAIVTPVIVAKELIQANETITDSMIDFVKYDKGHLYNGFFRDKNEIVGDVASHMISPGAVLTKRNVQRPYLVLRDQSVDLIAKTDTVVVIMKGIVKQNGSLNDLVKAYNPSSKKTLDAIVVGPSKLEVV